MSKMTVYEVITAIDEIRKITCPPSEGETKQLGIDQIIEADNKLIALHDRLLADYGDGPQSEQGFVEPSQGESVLGLKPGHEDE